MTELRTVTAVDIDPPKKQRRKPTPLTKRAMAECRKRGWIVESVEQTIRIPGGRTFKRDLFGCLDLLVITTGRRIVGIQVTGGQGGNRAAHRAKIEAEPRAIAFLLTGASIELWSYRKSAAGRYAKTVERAHLVDGAIAWTEQPCG